MKLSNRGKFWLLIGLPGCVAFWGCCDWYNNLFLVTIKNIHQNTIAPHPHV